MTPEDVLAKKAADSRAYRAAHPDRVHAAASRSARKNRRWASIGGQAAAFAHWSNRRSARLGITERLTATDVRQIEGPCAYCGDKATGWDHVVALWRGGRNHVSNLVRCCAACNKAKGVRTPEEWRAGVVVDRRTSRVA